jgi:hypothetical protein
VKAAGRDHNLLVVNTIDKPVLIGNASRPEPLKVVPQGFGLTFPSERIALDVLNQLEYT